VSDIQVQELNPRPSWASSDGHIDLLGPDRTTPADAAIDKMLVAETLARFGFTFDERDRAGLEDCFTEDAVFTASIGGTQDLGTFRGRDKAVRWLTAYWETQTDQRRHLVTNVMVDHLTEDSAVATCMLFVTCAKDGAMRPQTAGFYCTRMRREADGAWRIQHFDAGFDAAF
jgi:ketosteroid isomerase-like protein